MVDINNNKFTDDELIIVSLLVDKITLLHLLTDYSEKSTNEMSNYIADTGAKFLSNMSDSKAQEYIDNVRDRMDNARHGQ